MCLDQKNSSDTFKLQVIEWLNNTLTLLKALRQTDLDDKTSTVDWANEWVSKTDYLDAELDRILRDFAAAEDYNMINSKENYAIINHLLQILNEMNKVTSNMYKIISHDHSERIRTTKAGVEHRLHNLLELQKTLLEQLDNRKKEQRKQEIEKRLPVFHYDSEKMKQEMRAKAREEHEKYLAKRDAIEALNKAKAIHIDDTNSIISSHSYEEREQLEESPSKDRRKKRRSRSLTRKVVRKVQKTFRRSVSVLHNYMEHHHHE
uniref:Spermatogenic leucine zipper protein 1 n=1 Tax=Caenorhabditis tropicalis TaxID=1561998 RepID=A0A1I7U785_9PELO